jgi:hypothetical protein
MLRAIGLSCSYPIAEDKAMREQEMRLRVFRFLKARMRNMIMPAAMGIGLGGAGCLPQSAGVYSTPVPSDAAIVKSDANRDQAIAFDLAPGTDAIDTGLGDAPADVFAPTDGQPDLRYPEAGMKYFAPIPIDAATTEAGGEAGPIIAKYVAPMPDAAIDLGLAVRYMAQMPDSGA